MALVENRKMKFDVNKLEWTREPKEFYISEEKLRLLQNRIQICGRELIITFETIMHRCYR